MDYILTEHYRNKIEQAGGRLLPVDIGFDMDALTLNVFNVATDMMLVKMFLKIHRRAKAEIPKYDCVIYDSLIFSGESLTKEAKKTGICSITTFAVSESIAADFVSFNRFFDRILRNRIVRRSITRILNRTILKGTEHTGQGFLGSVLKARLRGRKLFIHRGGFRSEAKISTSRSCSSVHPLPTGCRTALFRLKSFAVN